MINKLNEAHDLELLATGEQGAMITMEFLVEMILHINYDPET